MVLDVNEEKMISWRYLCANMIKSLQ